ncbi:MAG: 4'-phosphopantetheinyl transferase superfamily protein [Halioglobus sp.]|nr:4'-phosphopantetheinyl transferase superfamily protein [Halioglobus sp.]
MSLTIGARDVHLWLAPRAADLESEFFCRDVLSRYADVPPVQWVFEKVGEGKPRIVDPPLPLEFNLSHSVDWMVCAVSCGVPVGVDIEHVARKRDVMRLARRFFGEGEVAMLEALVKGEQRDGFFDLWTLKESAVKARAEALLPLLNKVFFALEGPAAKPIAITEGFGGSYLLLDPVPEYRLALCWLGEEGATPALRLFHWHDNGAFNEAEPTLRSAT